MGRSRASTALRDDAASSQRGRWVGHTARRGEMLGGRRIRTTIVQSTTMAIFSVRNGHEAPATISVRDEAPEEFRRFLVDALERYLPVGYHQNGCEFVFAFLGVVPRHSWRSARYAVLHAPWYKVYDLTETANQKLASYGIENADGFRLLINHFFESHGYAYKLTPDGYIEHRGSESFEWTMSSANIALSAARLATAESEIHKAIQSLSKRPNPDLTGAVQHAMAGLECAAKHITNEPKLELGKIVKKHTNLFPQPLGDVVSQLYGFASNNGRHLNEGGEPDFAESELIVGIAAAGATYLARKVI